MQDHAYTPPPDLFSGSASVDNDAVKHAIHSVKSTVRISAFFSLTVFFAAAIMVVELEHIVQSGRTSIPRGGDDRTT